jgi:eukaryotic-like serine/threonine-protein kinase
MKREQPSGPKPNQPQVASVPPDDDLLMSLVESTLECPPGEREAFARSACASDEVFAHVWKYVEREQRLGQFLRDPLFRPGLPEQPFEPGELLEGRFRVISEVARGGMGIVYEAFDEKLGRRIAIKCARPGFGRSLPPEVRHASEVSHANICKIYELHTAHTARGEIDFLTMEFLEGETLTERIVRSHGDVAALPRRQAMAIGRQIAAGLAAAHQAGLVHGDLKSNNVILTGAGANLRAVITDFGLARRPGVTDPEGRSAQVGGAPDYMAPELLKGGKPSLASDVYALGVILYELMTGRRPFPANLSRESRLRLVPDPARSPWDRTLARCLDPDPARRLASGQEVLDAITPNRGRLWLGVAGAVLVASIGLGVWSYRAATAPEQSVRLAILPVDAPAELAADARELYGAARTRVGALQGSSRIAFSLLDLAPEVHTPDQARQAEATHALSIELRPGKGGITLLANVRDVNGTKVDHWEANYSEQELRYAPRALAGFASFTFHLPLAAVAAALNAGAKLDYDQAVALLPRRSQTARVLELLDRAVKMDPDSALVRAALGEAQWLKWGATAEAAWADRARESARQAEIRDPDLAPVQLITGLMLLRAGKYDEAVAHYQRALELEPNNSDAYRRIGAAYHSKGQDAQALAMLNKAVATAPGNYLALWERGSHSYRLGQNEAAAVDLEKATKLAPDEPGPLTELAQVYLNGGNAVQAEQAARHAVELQPTARTLNVLGQSLLYQAKPEQALPYLQQAAQLRPLAWNWLYLAVAQRLSAQPTQALATNRKALQLARAELEQDYRSGVHRALVAYLSAQLGDQATALSETHQALEFAPSDADTQWLAALTMEALHQRADALHVLETAGPWVLKDISRWPDAVALARDPAFLRLVSMRAQ